jgi:hypothetical protein
VDNKDLYEDLFLGFTCVPVSNWKDLVTEPQVPKNYTKPETIENWLQVAWKLRQEQAAQMPLAGDVQAACVIDADGQQVGYGTGVELYTSLSGRLADYRDADVPPLRLWAIEGRKLLHLCAVQAAREGKLIASWGLYLEAFMSMPQPIRNVVEVWDPARLVLGSEGLSIAKVELLEKHLAQRQSGSLRAVFNPENPEQQAQFVRGVWRSFGLDKAYGI